MSDVRAVVAGHGDFAAGLVSAVQQITGKGNVFVALSARDLSGVGLEALLRKTIEESGARVVFTDLQAGSCTMAARRVLRDRQDVLFIAGANLPMLLDFALSAEADPVVAAQHAMSRGRDAIAPVVGPQAANRKPHTGS
jgi:N-acetylgalactosamine PTS system EIIA component